MEATVAARAVTGAFWEAQCLRSSKSFVCMDGTGESLALCPSSVQRLDPWRPF